MRLEGARERELTEPMADHVLRHVHRDELPAVVDGERVAHELRRNRGTPRPRLEHLFLTAAVELLDPLHQPLVDEGAFLQRTSHRALLLLPPGDDVAVRRPGAATGLVALGRLAPRGHRMVAFALAFATTSGVVAGVHHRAAHGWTESEPSFAAGLAPRDVLVIGVPYL